jgi:hypothetical protein
MRFRDWSVEVLRALRGQLVSRGLRFEEHVHTLFPPNRGKARMLLINLTAEFWC